MTKISIITINYNNAAGLERTILSVAGQSYQDIEYILIDGDSTDGSKAVIEKYKTQFSFVVSEKDHGVYDAQNKGLKQATGDYVLVLNSGDELASPAVLAEVFASNHSEDIVYGNMVIVYPNGKRENGYMPGKLTFEHMMRDTLWHPVSFVKKDFLNKVGLYDTSYKIVADYDWFLRAIFIHQASLKYIQQFISVFYLGGLSSVPENIEKIKAERLRSQLEVFGEHKVNDWYARLKKSKKSLLSKFINRLKP